MAKDKEYNKLIHKNKWLKLRKAKLSSNPICERCKEKPATEVHHIKPVEDGIGSERYRLMYDPSRKVFTFTNFCTNVNRGGHFLTDGSRG